MFKCCMSKRVVNTTFEIDKKKSKEFTKSIKKNIKKMRKSNFNEKDYNNVLLGYGGSSETFKIRINSIDVTCKKIKKSERNYIHNEVKLLKLMSYETHFPVFYNKLVTNSNVYLLYRYIDGVDLYQMIKEPLFSLDNNTISKIILEIATGLDYLFYHNYVHLDIKLENIIIKKTKPVRIKIIDLAFCQKINKFNNKLENWVGTSGYCAPEIILHKRYYHNSDIWSLGILLSILFQKFDIFGNNWKKYYKNMKNYNNFDDIKSHLLIKDKDVLDLLANMLIKNPNNRYSIKDVLNHKYILQEN